MDPAVLRKYLMKSGLMMIVLILVAHGQSLKFEHISIEAGLSHTTVRQMVQDQQGLLWIITPDGLNRYDGYEFKNYRHDPFDTTSLTANSHNTLLVDRQGVLWIGTFDGLCRYDPIKDQFKRYQHDPDDPASLNHSYVSALYEDKHGVLWVGTGAGINRFDAQEERFERPGGEWGDPFGFSGRLVSAMIDDPRPESDVLWIGTATTGLVRLDRQSGRFTHHFRPRDENREYLAQYPPELFQAAAQLRATNRLLAAVTGGVDSTVMSQEFRLERSSRLLVVSSGEGFGEILGDWGWIERKQTGERVWGFSLPLSKHMAGSLKNRIHAQVISLPAGSYNVFFRSDGSDGRGGWNANPPQHEALWGISVFQVAESMSSLLASMTAGEWHPELVSSNRIASMAVDPLGGSDGPHVIWVGTDGGGLNEMVLPEAASADSPALYHDRHHVTFRVHRSDGKEEAGIASDHVQNLYFDREGKLWIATAYGLSVYDRRAGTFHHFRHDPTNPSSLSSNYVNSILEDRGGTLWLGTSRGMNKLSRYKLQFRHIAAAPEPFAQPARLRNGSISALFVDDAGNLWVSTHGGELGQLDPESGRFNAVNFRGLPGERLPAPVTSIVETALEGERVFWLATGRGLIRFQPESGLAERLPVNPADSSSLPTEEILHLSPGSGGVWVAMGNHGFVLLDPKSGKVRRFVDPFRQQDSAQPREERLLSMQIWCTLEDTLEGRPVLWLGTIGGGLSRMDIQTARYTHFFEEPYSERTVNNKSVTTLFKDRLGRFWIGTYSGGLNRYLPEDGSFRHYTVEQGLSNNMVMAIEADNSGRLWLATNSGLSRFDPETENFKKYDVNDGLQSNQFNLKASARDRKGRLYLGGINGINIFNPDSLRINLYPPPVIVTDFKIFDQSVVRADCDCPLHEKAIYELDEITLQYDQNFFSFEFVALDFTNPLRNEYAYRLEGFDPDWIFCGKRRYASYTNLDPGRYRFRVRGANSDGTWNEASVPVTIIVEPPWWRTWWFFMLVLLSVSAAAYGFHTFKVRQKVLQMVEVERVRKKAAADFHDEMGHKLTKISLFSEILNRKLSGITLQNREYLERINDLAGSLYHGMRDFLWTLDPEKDSLYEVAIRLKDFGDEFFDQSGIAFHAEGIEPELQSHVLTMDWKRHLTLLFKEAMNNVLKHSHSTNVTLEFQLEGDRVTITLTDDGRGYNGSAGVIVPNGTAHTAENGHGGNGIRNMISRAQKLDSSLQIYDNNPCGATVEFTGKLPA